MNINRKVIAQTINWVVFIKKTADGRKIEELARVVWRKQRRIRVGMVRVTSPQPCRATLAG